MLLGGWGAQAAELIERAGGRRAEAIHRVDRLTMTGAPQGAERGWCCWLFGEPEDRGALAGRFGAYAPGELPGAFARALAALGEAACELLCGRFVVVALDRERDRCLVVRDQLGAQPLVYARTGDGALFAEHECALLELLPRTPTPDRLALLGWIETAIPLRGRTFYEGIERLPAGHRLASDRTPPPERWWQPRYEGIEQGSSAALAERLREAAFAAVARAAAGSGRAAVKLSGGLDSACVAAGLAAGGFADRGAVAIGGAFAAHPEADERELIEATAQHTRLRLELIAHDPTASMLAPALAHIARWRLPPATPTLFLWRPLQARARELGVDAMLDGEGGDELFGLATYLIADLLRAVRPAAAWSLTARVPGIGLHPNRRVRLRVLRRYGVGPLLPPSLRRRRQLRASRHLSANTIVPPADARALAELRAAGEQRHDGPLWWQKQAESLIEMRDLLDMGAHFRREAADAGFAIRHPLLHDLRLIETVLALPPRAQFDTVRDRPLLRDALRGLIPEAVRTRHAKSHFTPLVLAGMRAEEAGLIDPLREADAPIRDYVATRALERRIETAPEDRAPLGAGPLWRVAIANSWLASLTGSSPPHPAVLFPSLKNATSWP